MRGLALRAREGHIGPPVDPALTTSVVEFNDLDALERAPALVAHGVGDRVMREDAMTPEQARYRHVEPGHHARSLGEEYAAGGPIEAYQDASESMAIPDMLAPTGDAYVLKVRGDSMIEAHIEDGDYVLIRPQSTARDGDIVVAQVEENAVTLKRYFREQGRIRLQPVNASYEPMYYRDVRIQGKLIGVIRRLD